MAELEGKTQEERIAALVSAVGGPVRAAALLGKTRTHVDNMRKAGAPLRLEDVLVLARESGVTLDWVATGQAVRPDLRGLADAGSGGFDALPNFVRLLPLRPEVISAGGRTIERWTPSRTYSAWSSRNITQACRPSTPSRRRCSPTTKSAS